MATRPSLLIPAFVALAAAPFLHADTTGRISGTVTTKDGKPVPNATITLSRLDLNWKKDLKVDARGAFFQIGLEPKEFELSVSAPGFTPYKEKIKIPLGDVLTKNVTLLTAGEAPATAAAAASPASSAENASIEAENQATEAFNAAVGFYSGKEYAQALAPCQKAYNGFKEALEKTTDEMAKGNLNDKFEKTGRLLGMVHYNLGQADAAKPLLAKHLEKNPKDGVVVAAMLKIAKDSKDKAEEAKYQALMDEIAGPQPEIPYNEGVTALNAGNMKGAKEGALKALKVKADYADAYYILGIAEFGLNNMKAAKEALRKYLELAPNGKKAGEVKEMLHSF
jgi:tetratricopeptide (TPR) repeat protein